jgi:uncharacterized protein YndB with AHSA1/START domain
MDVVGGGSYRLEFGDGGTDTSVFYGKYLVVVPNERIVRTNDEGDEGAVTTVTFEDRDGRTLLIYHETYPSAESLEEALEGSATALPEQLQQREDCLQGLATSEAGNRTLQRRGIGSLANAL